MKNIIEKIYNYDISLHVFDNSYNAIWLWKHLVYLDGFYLHNLITQSVVPFLRRCLLSGKSNRSQKLWAVLTLFSSTLFVTPNCRCGTVLQRQTSTMLHHQAYGSCYIFHWQLKMYEYVFAFLYEDLTQRGSHLCFWWIPALFTSFHLSYIYLFNINFLVYLGIFEVWFGVKNDKAVLIRL